MSYTTIQMVESDCALAIRFNGILKHLSTLKRFTAPECISNRKTETASAFYDVCMLETWCAKVVHTLKEWRAKLGYYQSEFSCNWKDYATTKKYEYEKSEWYEGEELSLKDFHIKHELYESGFSNLIFDTTKEDMVELARIVVFASEIFSVKNITNFFGKGKSCYVIDEDGEPKPLSEIKKVEIDASEQADAIEDATFLVAIQMAMLQILDDIKKLSDTEDEKDEAIRIYNNITCTLNNAVKIEIKHSK